MEYVVLKVLSTLDSSRLYRLIAIRKDISLRHLGIAIITSFNGKLTHTFTFTDKKYVYNPIEETDLFYDNDVFMADYSFNDIYFDKLGQFLLEYDPSENYQFKIQVDAKMNIDSSLEAILIDGKGYGILEDNALMLYNYLHGKDFQEPDSNNRPWNLEENMKVSDFDKPIDTNKLNIKIQNEIKYASQED